MFWWIIWSSLLILGFSGLGVWRMPIELIIFTMSISILAGLGLSWATLDIISDYFDNDNSDNNNYDYF